MRPPLRLGVVYDFRQSAAIGMDNPSFYAAILDQVAWLDGPGPRPGVVHRASFSR